jgi:erythritol kinase
MACEASGLAGTKATRPVMLKALDARVGEATPGSALYHPYIFEAGERGPFLDPHARAQFSGLSTRTTLSGLMRAVYEGLAFAARDCYTASGPIPPEVRMGGGAARSSALRGILASVLGAPVRTVSREEAGAAGAAMTAAVCLGAYPDLQACAADWVTPLLGEATPPDPALEATYARLFPLYQSIRTAMRPAWSALAAAREVMP